MSEPPARTGQTVEGDRRPPSPLHEGWIHLAGPPRAFVESADRVVRQFIDGRADGPLPV